MKKYKIQNQSQMCFGEHALYCLILMCELPLDNGHTACIEKCVK
jgi:hypothetical protein